MRYTLKQLNYIDVAAQHRSITGAAKALNISASSISSAIDAIEIQTNKKLFTRLPSKGISTTQFGHVFLSNARQLLKLAMDCLVAYVRIISKKGITDG